MKVLAILGSLLVSQSIFAYGSLTSRTKHLLRTGGLFKLELFFSGKATTHTTTRDRLDALAEINASPEALQEAQAILLTEYGRETNRIDFLHQMLEYQKLADSLGLELSLNTIPVALMIVGTGYATKTDLDKLRDEIIRESKRKVTDKDRFSAFD